MNKDSKILIVGHDDIIENSLFSYFQSNGYENVFSSSKSSLDTTDQQAVEKYFVKNKPEYVFLASTRSGGIEANQKCAAEFMYHNLVSQNNIIFSSKENGVKKLLFYASSCVYPKICEQPMREDMILTGQMEKTSEPYSTAKAAGIKLCQAFKKQYDFNAIVMIPATVFGPQSNTDIESSHVIGALLNKFHTAVTEQKDEVVVWGTGKPRREFLYIDDFIDASLFLMDKYDGDDVVNVGSGSDMEIKELANIIAEICGFQGGIVFDETKLDGTMQKLLDNSKISELGFKTKVNLEDGIKKTYNWFSAEGGPASGGKNKETREHVK
jgi:GDP-L-fucose synthase